MHLKYKASEKDSKLDNDSRLELKLNFLQIKEKLVSKLERFRDYDQGFFSCETPVPTKLKNKKRSPIKMLRKTIKSPGKKKKLKIKE
jgi:hypothetical protein